MQSIRKYYDKTKSKGITFTDKSLAQQQFRDEANINNIIKRYENTGLLVDPTAKAREIQFGDYTEMPDYMEAQALIMEANEQFADLPARIRKEFDNNPALFLDFCSDSKNYDRAVELGLIDLETQPTIPIIPEEKPENSKE